MELTLKEMVTRVTWAHSSTDVEWKITRAVVVVVVPEKCQQEVEEQLTRRQIGGTTIRWEPIFHISNNPLPDPV